MHVYIGDGRLDRRHVAVYAFAAGRTGTMMGVLLKRCRARSIGHSGAVTRKADLVWRKPQFGIIRGAVHVVTTGAGDAAPIHDALYEIVALHAILVRCTVRKMSEARLAELVLFELPIILEVESDVESDRPVVVFALDGILKRAALRMALDAAVVGIDVVHARGILNIRA